MMRAALLSSIIGLVGCLAGCDDGESPESAPIGFGTGGNAGEMTGTGGLPGTTDTDASLPAANPSGQGFVGSGCTSDTECASGLCRPYGPNGETICAEACGAERTCPAGSACNEDGLCEPGGPQVPSPADPTPNPPIGPALDTCAGIVQCLQDCGSDDVACQQACVDSADEESRTLYEAAAECIRMSGCEGSDNACINQACGDEINACFASPEPEPGPEPEPEPEPVDPPQQDLSCADILTCLQACGAANNECNEDCLARGTPEALAGFNAATECIQNSGCGPNDQACISAACNDEINACLNPGGDAPVDPVDPVEPADPPVEFVSCTDALVCLDECVQGDGEPAQCIAECDALVSEELRAQWISVLSCLDENECNRPADCAESCGDELAVCRGESPEPVDPVEPIDPVDPADPVEPAPNDTACRPLGDCIVGCEDAFCQRACLDEAEPEARAEYDVIGECLNDNNCYDADQSLDFLCLVDNCLADYERCFAAPVLPAGDGGCRDFLRCLSDCDDDDAECLQGCVAGTSRESYEQYDELVTCWAEAPCEGAGNVCRFEACNASYFACSESGIEFGENLCGPVRLCIDACDDDATACIRECFDEGSQDAQRQYLAYSYCTADTDCDDLQSCADACPRETAICQGDDAGPAPGNDACLDYYICRGGCETVECLERCEDSAAAEGVELFSAIQDCANDNRCFTFDGGLDDMCFAENCADTVIACIGENPEPTGAGGCGAYVDCANDCGEGDLRCQRACLENTSEEAYERLVTAVDCIESNCPNGDAQCISDRCGQALDACLNDE